MREYECTICENEFKILQDYGGNTCPHCGQKYEYYEDHVLELSESQIKALRRHSTRGKVLKPTHLHP